MPPDPIIVTADDIERVGHPGRHSIYRYRRVRIVSIDAWCRVMYSPIIERSREPEIWIARVLELKLTGMHEGTAKAWLAENDPVWIPSSEDDRSIATLANPRPVA